MARLREHLRESFRALREVFTRVDVQGFQLLGMARRFLGRGQVAGLDWCDEMLLRRVPALGRYCRYAVLTLRR